MAYKGYSNLIPTTLRPKEEARAFASKGGINSAKSRQEKKNLRELVEIVFDMPLKANAKVLTLKELKSLAGLKNSNPTAAIAGVVQLARKVAKGDLKAIKLWFDIAGEPLKRDINLSGSLAVKSHNLSCLSDEELCVLAKLVAKTTCDDTNNSRNSNGD